MSAYFTFVYEKINQFFSKLSSPYLRILIGGIVLGLLVFLMPPLYGEGHEVINHLKEGHPELSLSSNIFGWHLENPWVVIFLLGGLVLFKVVATSVTAWYLKCNVYLLIKKLHLVNWRGCVQLLGCSSRFRRPFPIAPSNKNRSDK